MSDWYKLTKEQEQILADVFYEEARENSEEDFKKMSWFGKSLQEPTEEETQNAHRYTE